MLPAPTLLFPSAPPPSATRRKPRRRPPRSPRPGTTLDQSAEVMAVMATLPTTPTVSCLADALGWAPGDVDRVLGVLERNGLVESWPDPIRASEARVMLSARAVARLGLVLSPRADRWIGRL